MPTAIEFDRWYKLAHHASRWWSRPHGTVDNEITQMGNWRTIELPQIHDVRGNLTFVEGNRHVPFDIRRVYYLYDVPGGAERAGHAHKQLRQVIIAMSGSFDLHLDDGEQQETITLRRAHIGVLLDSMVWRVIDNFSSGAVCLCLASLPYEEADYYRSYSDFRANLRNRA